MNVEGQPKLNPHTKQPIGGSITGSSAREVSSLILTSLLNCFAPVEPGVVNSAIEFYKGRKQFTSSLHLDLWQNGFRIANPTISGVDSREWIVASMITREFWQSVSRKKDSGFDSFLVASNEITSDKLVELKNKYAATMQGIRSICEGLALLPPCAEKTFLDKAFGFDNNSTINYKLHRLSTKELKFFEQLISKAKEEINLDLTTDNCFKVQWTDQNGEFDSRAKAPCLFANCSQRQFHLFRRRKIN